MVPPPGRTMIGHAQTVQPISSLTAHAGAGLTVYLCCSRWRSARSLWTALVFIVTAIAPDLDYLAVWLFEYAARPRFSHSLLFALVVMLLVWHVTSRWSRMKLHPVWLLCAAVSHALMDFLVGAHPVPLFWPLSAGVAMPVGLLPSAGALDPGNIHLWKNLLIELGVLGPVFSLAVATSRRGPMRAIAAWVIPIAPLWLGFVGWSLALGR